MHKTIPAWFLGAAMFLVAAPALAIDESGRWWTSVMVSGIDEDKKRGLETEWSGLHLGVGRGFGADWGVELNAVGARFENRAGDRALIQWGFGADVTRRMFDSQHFSPYVLMGLGWMNSDYKLNRYDESGMMASLGLGVMVPTGIKDVRVRGELRSRRDFGEELTDLLLSIGVQVGFGQSSVREPAWAVDSDGDGVPDTRDRCPDTPPGAVVDKYGCRIDQDGPTGADEG